MVLVHLCEVLALSPGLSGSNAHLQSMHEKPNFISDGHSKGFLLMTEMYEDSLFVLVAFSLYARFLYVGLLGQREIDILRYFWITF